MHTLPIFPSPSLSSAVTAVRRRSLPTPLPLGSVQHTSGYPSGKRRGRRAATPPFPHLVDEALAARALYLDALGGLFYSSSLHSDLQHSVLKAGVDLALVRALRQRHAATEGAVAALPDMVVTTFLFFVNLVLAGDRQDPV